MQKAGEAEDYTESDDEGADSYRKGGYHWVTVGEIYNNRYKVIAKLGWGHFSTVWLCQDLTSARLVAMKVQKSASHYTEAAYDEMELLAEVAKRAGLPEWCRTARGPRADLFPQQTFTGLVQLCDYFQHDGPNGRHVCMVFETLGPNVLGLIKRYNFKGVPLGIVRKVAANTLIGLDYLHRICGIIHTDLKPENVLVGCPRGVPVDKRGVPLIGIPDPEAAAARIAARDAAAQVKEVAKPNKKPSREERKKAKKEKKKAKEAAPAPGEGEDALPNSQPAEPAEPEGAEPPSEDEDDDADADADDAVQAPELEEPLAAAPVPPPEVGTAALDGTATDEAAAAAPPNAPAPKPAGIISPPYMRPHLKPSRS